MRLSTDVGGTFTDLVMEEDGQLRMYKALTTPEDPVIGVLDVLNVAASDCSTSVEQLLGACEIFVHATTRATNAILTGDTARTAFLTTEGHPDILLLREGGRKEPFNYTVPYPNPYVPRSLTFEIPERIGSEGEIVKPLDETAVLAVIERLKKQEIQAIGVCLLWSIVNPVHERRLGELLDRELPGIPYTLSHKLNPSIREYRRASSTCIDASLKPLMGTYLGSLQSRLMQAGFRGRLLTVTSLGSVVDAAHLAEAPIHSVKSGPSMAPVAGRFYAVLDGNSDTAIVADTGGTSYDVSLVRRGSIPWTRETWLGEPFRGHMTGFPSVDVRSIGAGGGSIAWVDQGGMLHVGPRSAGSTPGPACYGRGGEYPTVTDAALVLGYIDPDYFLGGAIGLDVEAAIRAIEAHVGAPLGLDLHEAASAILSLSTESMIHAIEDVTINQGIDPSTAVLIGGGGAGGLNAVRIARRLGCPGVVIPAVGATLSAASALMSDLSTEYSATYFTTSADFEFDSVNSTLEELEGRCVAFINGPGTGTLEHSIEYFAEARYPHQIWEVEVPIGSSRFSSSEDVEHLVARLHAAHEELFAFSDPGSEIEIVTWRAKVTCRLPRASEIVLVSDRQVHAKARQRRAWFPDRGMVTAMVEILETMPVGHVVHGPCIVESSFTTVVVDPGASVERMASGSLWIRPSAPAGSRAGSKRSKADA
ncbi:hydantoinase/oxoprolinase family protein [Microvirga massiliensis]|uniref:hydantoinase/oxoprolinase family protein n=1 Tax=Microvirga massiliensis TaxID=1033741 RepID=UPI00062B63E8|nr:hydantoinase/oxoprolinase family protein [Microvirga massiliensis]